MKTVLVTTIIYLCCGVAGNWEPETNSPDEVVFESPAECQKVADEHNPLAEKYAHGHNSLKFNCFPYPTIKVHRHGR